MRTKAIKIDDDVMDVLRQMAVTGNVATLPGQLERKLYERTDKALKALGGKWNRKAGGHVFGEDPRPLLGQAIDDGQVVDVKKSLGQFYTPADVASRMVDEAYLKPGLRILEPSCGDGRIIAEVFKALPHGADTFRDFLAVELDVKTADKVRETFGMPHFRVRRADFLELLPSNFTPFDRVLMNPPFNDGADIKHIEHALRFLKPGGVLIAICAAGPRQHEFYDSQAREAASFWWEYLPEGTFKAEGTGVRTAMFMLRTPEIITATMAPPVPRKMQDRATKPLQTAPLLDMLCR